MKRLFIAINLPQNIKEKIAAVIDDLRKQSSLEAGRNIRFIEPKNWHLTISFLGYQPDEAINSILESIKETVKHFSKPFIEFEKIILAPPNRPARMVWLIGSRQSSQTLNQIKKDLENNLIENGVRLKQENREFNCHLTLVRFQLEESRFQGVELPEIEKLSFTSQSLDLMESHLRPAGAEYEILANLTFLNE